MYQHPTNSSSSPTQRPSGAPTGLTRFSSAPGSFLTRAVDSVLEARGGGGGGSASGSPSSHVGHQSHNNNQHLHHHHQTQQHQYHHYLSGDSSPLTSESTCKASSSGGGGGSALVRQKSSPAGFLGHLVSENGFSITRGSERYNSDNGSAGGHGVSRLKSQLSFTRQDSLSQISEGSESEVEGISSENRRQNSTHSYSPAGFGVEPWDNGSSIAFSGPPNRRVKGDDGDFYNCLNTLETQFSLPQTALEMATMDKLLNIPEDSVPCRIRAKRGCATHPRSIAERERRTRISGKLKKLQELVPNMDKQTSYADMLDLAVQHIKGLQDEVQRLHKELETCTCGCKQPM